VGSVDPLLHSGDGIVASAIGATDVTRAAYQDGDYEAVHGSAFWAAKVDFIIATHIGFEDGRNQWEQIPSRRLGNERFEVCCIPFFAADLSLGDIVETDGNFTITSVITRSGHETCRVWLAELDEGARVRVLDAIKPRTDMLEWSSPNLLSISIQDGTEAAALNDILQRLERSTGLAYDIGRTWFEPSAAQN